MKNNKRRGGDGGLKERGLINLGGGGAYVVRGGLFERRGGGS